MTLRSMALRLALAAAATAALAGCATSPPLAAGLSEAEVLQRLGPPTGRYPMSEGATRLEYATGPMGKMTWMVDVNAQGRVTAWFQALEESRLHAFMARAPGLSEAEVLRTLGRPGETRPAGLACGTLWSWRYVTNDCLWFQATLDNGRVRDAGFGIDWICDGMNDAKASS